ncbi:hypothetical protein SRABI134_03087 [Peribacillus sp. Bi134]|nr:hypothetical protein SRABI134_03087 [Peribacillus sp. Bi134]
MTYRRSLATSLLQRKWTTGMPFFQKKISDMYLNVVALNTKDVDAQIPKDIISVVESDQFEKVIDDKFRKSKLDELIK